MSDDLATIAHVLRRTTFGPHPGQVARYARLGVARTIDALLDAPVEQLPTALVEHARIDDYEALPRWWIERMRRPADGVHEKLVWYWHSHFTSSVDKAQHALMWRQHHLLRRHALDNFRDLVQAIAIDAAMLRYLDGDGSRGEAPNENFARELMELFCLGPGSYTEADVRAGARIFSGWRVEGEAGTVVFDEKAAYDRPVLFLGKRQKWTMESAIDAVVDHPACATHVARRLWAFYAGTTPSTATLDKLAGTFRDAKLDIRTLLGAILRNAEFLDARHTRARQPLEWLLALMAATATAEQELDLWWLDQLGQVPFRPPNVAGWPLDGRWAAAGQVLLRTAIATSIELDPAVIDAVEPTTDAVLTRLGIHDASAQTREALDRALAAQTEYDRGLELLLVLAANAPEFTLA